MRRVDLAVKFREVEVMKMLSLGLTIDEEDIHVSRCQGLVEGMV